MKLNRAETLLVNNPFRALSQRYFEAPFYRRVAGSLEGARVLEIGCGRGMGVRMLVDDLRAATVYAVDLDPAQLRRARRIAAARCALAAADAERLPFKSQSFDAIADFGVLHHVPDWQSAIGEIARVLRPRGRFLFGEVTAKALTRRSYKLLFEHPSANRFSEDQFLAELTAHGMRVLDQPRRVLRGDIFLGVAQRSNEPARARRWTTS